MKRNLRVITLFILLCLTLIPSEAVCVSSIVQKIPSNDYIITQKHVGITLVQGEEDYYVVSANNSDTEILNVNDNSDLIFGEDAFTEDNILKHYIFNKNKIRKNRHSNRVFPTSKNNTVYTKFP